jgi:hypothetical protein
VNPYTPRAGDKVWLGCKQVSIDAVEADGAVIVMHARRGGFARLRYDAREVAQLIELDLLRLYVKPVRKERA